jgi:hypothetical protein
MSPERFVAVVGLAFGLLLCVLTPPFAAPDEPAHMYRAWSIANGRLLVRGGGAWVPTSYVDLATQSLRQIRGVDSGRAGWGLIRRLAHIPLRSNVRSFVRVPAESWKTPLGYTAPSYTPVGYLASAPAVLLCNLVNAPPLVHLYAARVANVIVATILLVFAIAHAPFGKWTLTLAALVPMSVYVRASSSIDGLTTALAYLLIAAGLREARGGPTTLQAFLVSAIKPGYLLVPLAAIRRRLFLAIVIATVLGVAASIFWASGVAGGTPDRLVAAAKHPLTFASAFVADWRSALAIRIVELVGVFGWLDAPVPFAFAVTYLIVMAIVAIADGPSSRDFGARRLLFLAIFAGTVILITVTTHAFGPPGRFALFQGRYLLPVLPLPFLAIVTPQSGTYVRSLSIAMVIAGIAQTVYTELFRFYF